MLTSSSLFLITTHNDGTQHVPIANFSVQLLPTDTCVCLHSFSHLAHVLFVCFSSDCSFFPSNPSQDIRARKQPALPCWRSPPGRMIEGTITAWCTFLLIVSRPWPRSVPPCRKGKVERGKPLRVIFLLVLAIQEKHSLCARFPQQQHIVATRAGEVRCNVCRFFAAASSAIQNTMGESVETLKQTIIN